MFTAQQIAAHFGITEEQASAALAGIDQAAIEAQEDARHVAEVWDKTSPINGRPAEMFLAKLPDGGEAYLVKVDGAVRTFQPHAPFVAGIVPMTSAAVATYAEQDRARIASEAAAARTLAQAAEALEA